MKTLFFFLSFPFLSFAQTGTIAGNAFWKYNDFVGNKPDAGSKVYVFPSNLMDKELQIKCDVQGNFKFDNVKPGKYLVVIISENTNDLFSNNFSKLNNPALKNYLGFSIPELNKTIYDSLPVYKKLYELQFAEEEFVEKNKL